jgi:hypothetical protein
LSKGRGKWLTAERMRERIDVLNLILSLTLSHFDLHVCRNANLAPDKQISLPEETQQVNNKKLHLYLLVVDLLFLVNVP